MEKPFIVPGGRFREMYYWDSYWTIQGLLVSQMKETVKGGFRDERRNKKGGGAHWGETKNVAHQNILQKFFEIQLDQVIFYPSSSYACALILISAW